MKTREFKDIKEGGYFWHVTPTGINRQKLHHSGYDTSSGKFYIAISWYTTGRYFVQPDADTFLNLKADYTNPLTGMYGISTSKKGAEKLRMLLLEKYIKAYEYDLLKRQAHLNWLNEHLTTLRKIFAQG